MLELLAPAGSMEAGAAAVQNGADAIYDTARDTPETPAFAKFCVLKKDRAARVCPAVVLFCIRMQADRSTG